MKIVMSYTLSDDCTYSSDHVICMEAESIEAAYCEFVDLYEKGEKFEYCGYEFYGCEFEKHNFPEFRELDDWFEYNKFKGV